MSTQTREPAKPRSQYADEAVQLALQADWEAAAELNRFILETFGPEEEAQNRLGKALSELGRLDEARGAYEATLAINPHNSIARKNTAKLEALANAKDVVLSSGQVKVDMNLFVEEMGKTTTTTLKAVDREASAKITPGDVCELRVEGDGVEVDTVRGVRLGSLEAKLARRLIKFIQGGNRYLAGVTAIEGTQVKVIIREVHQDPKFQGKPSFPIVRRREAEVFRPYAKESLLSRDREVEVFAGDEDEDELEPAAAAAGIELEEGLHEVDDEDEDVDADEGLDFADVAAEEADEDDDDDD